jgi:hypothetical protein
MRPAAAHRRILRPRGLLLAIALAGGGAALLQGCGSSANSGMVPVDSGSMTGAGGAQGLGGSSGTGTGGRSTGAGGAASGMGGRNGADAGADSGAQACLVTIEPVSTESLKNVEAGRGATLRVRGRVYRAKGATLTWIWTVEAPSGLTIKPMSIDTDGAIVEFPVETPGNYQIVARILEDPTCFSTDTATTVAPAPTTFVLRASVAGYPVIEKRVVPDATSSQATEILLERGLAPLELSATDASSGAVLPSYLRVSLPSSTFSIDGDTLRGPFKPQVRPGITYDLLIVPSGQDAFAPDLISGPPENWSTLRLDPGIPVAATLRDGGKHPVAGALVVLRRGELPSTVGVSDQDGALSLRARGGTLAAFITPPASVGLPRISVGASGDPGIVLAGSASSLALTVAWNNLITAPLSVEVRTPGGGATMPGATVRVKSSGPAVQVGILTAQVNGGAPVDYPALGTTDIKIATGADGVAVFPPLPVGPLELTIVPALPTSATATPAAITTLPVSLSVGLPRQTITLATKARLTGMLLPVTESPGTRVTAIDGSITAAGTVVSAIVGADGSFTLSVDPGRTYQLLAEPPQTSTRARAMLGPVMSAPGTVQVAVQTLPAVRLLRGVVNSLETSVVPNVLVQAFCPAASAKCYDPTFALADAVSRSDGSFELRLPDPAQN